MIGTPQPLAEFYRDYYVPLRLIGASPKTVEQYEIALRHWKRFCGSLALSDIDDMALAAFVAALARSRSPATVAKTLRHVMSIVRLAAKRAGVVPPDPPAVRVSRRIPEAFTIDQVEAILAECRREPGSLAALPASRWWPALVLFVFDTGCRVGAALASVADDLAIGERSVLLRAETQKQRADQWHTLSDQAIAAIAALYPRPGSLVFPWPYGRGVIYKRFRRILDRAGVPAGRERGGLFHKLRKTTASYVHANGGDATYQLGHSSRQVTERYLDPRIARNGQAIDVLPRPEMPIDDPQMTLF